MKKLLYVILLISIFTGACSKEEFVGDEGLYVYTSKVKGFDEYVKEDFAAHTYTYYTYIDNSIELGKGIWVYGKENPLMIYPAWKNGEIIGVFSVLLYDGMYSGSYSDGNAEQLNYAIGKTDAKHPLRLYKNDEGFYMIIDEGIYKLGTSELKKVNNLALEIEIFTSTVLDYSNVINVNEFMEYHKIEE